MEEPVPEGQRYIEKFILYSALDEPDVDMDAYTLTVFGQTEKRVSFSYRDLMEMEHIRYTKDFHCVTGWSIRDVRWEGVSLKKLIEMAGPEGDPKWVMFHCMDEYSAPVPYEDAMGDDSIVALIMDGKPIPQESGFPARPFIPHLYGWKSAKWLNGIEIMQDYEEGYWELRGYHSRGNVWENERFKSLFGRHLKHSPMKKREQQ